MSPIMTDTRVSRHRKLPRIAWGLGYGGVIPFVGLAAAIVLNISLVPLGVADPVQALLGYGAVIISFIGAVYWGVALSGVGDEGQTRRMYIYSVLPALAGWVMLLLPQRVSLIGMAFIVGCLYLIDRRFLFRVIDSDYQILRARLSLTVGLSLLVAGVFS